MKALIKFLYFLLFIFVLTLLAGIFLPKAIYIEKDIYVKANAEIVFLQISDLSYWPEWFVYIQHDLFPSTEEKISISEKDETIKWIMDNGAEGKAIISGREENSKLSGLIIFGNYAQGDFHFILEEVLDEIVLHFSYEIADLGYFERYLMLMYKSSLADDFAESLDGIKTGSEALRLSRVSEPQLSAVSTMPLMVIFDTASHEDIWDRQVQSFKRIEKYLERRQIRKLGDPVSVYYSRDPNGDNIIASGFQIPKKTWGWKHYQCIQIDTSQVAIVTHWGDYASTKPYLTLHDYIESYGLKADSFIWETYLITPDMEADTSLWQKEVFFPVVE